MKYLHLNIFYRLPDDFDGDENDAIEHMLDYRRGEKNHQIDFTFDPTLDVYDNWWNMVNTTDRVLYGQMDFCKSSEDGNYWISEIDGSSEFIAKPNTEED